MRKKTDLLIINNVKVPAPDEGYEIIETTFVDGGRNANAAFIGQVIGRNQWKINNLQWSHLSADEWASLKRALKGFVIPVTFLNDYNEVITISMYPGDRTSTPCQVSANQDSFGAFNTCKFNLIDCGY